MKKNSISAAMGRWAKGVVLPIALLITLMSSGCSLFGGHTDGEEPRPVTPSPSEPKKELSAEEIAEQCGPSAVNVYAASSGGASLGSGVIYKIKDGYGYIITNDHVIRGVNSVEVHLLDKRSLKATIVATDPRRDVAVIKVEGDNLQAAELADSKNLNVGDDVIAIGNAQGVENSVTKGIISNLNVDVDTGINIRRCIQTDAPINHGNSGGALVNMKGKVVGINDMGRSDSESMNYAIPINDAKDVADQIIEKGYVSMVYVGVNLVNEKTNDGEGFLIIKDIMPNSPAAKFELKAGDIIIKVNDVRVPTVSKFREQIKNSGIGSTVSIGIARKGNTGYASGIIQVTLDELPKGYYSIDWS